MLYRRPDFPAEKTSTTSTNLPAMLVSHLDPLAQVDLLYLMSYEREMNGSMAPRQIINL